MRTSRMLFFLCSFCIFVGIIASYSLTTFTVLYFEYPSHFHFFYRQLIIGTFSILIMWSLSQLDPDKYFKPIGFLIFFLFAVTMGFMHYLPESMVTSAGGAKRWIRLPGISLAPVEFFKIGFVYFLAWSFARKINLDRKTFGQEFSLVLPYFLVFLIVIYLIAVMQNDIGQVIVLGLTLAIMALFAGIRFRFFWVIISCGVAVVAMIILSSENRIMRIKSWWSTVQNFVLSFFPESVAAVLRVENTPEPYQLSHSLNAINHGGLFGEGIGNGLIKLGFLSDVHTDFVLAGITEEIGAIGTITIALIFLAIIFIIFRIASRCENRVYSLFALGISLLILLSFIINAYGITSITPIKGISVPFLSYGGSSLLATSVGVGMVLMISKRSKA